MPCVPRPLCSSRRNRPPSLQRSSFLLDLPCPIPHPSSHPNHPADSLSCGPARPFGPSRLARLPDALMPVSATVCTSQPPGASCSTYSRLPSPPPRADLPSSSPSRRSAKRETRSARPSTSTCSRSTALTRTASTSGPTRSSSCAQASTSPVRRPSLCGCWEEAELGLGRRGERPRAAVWRFGAC